MEKIGTRRIETDRLILRRFTVEDAEAVYRNWACDPEVTKFLTWPVHPDADATRKLLEIWTARYAQGDFFNWAIVYRETGEVIGNISVTKLREEISAAEIGYCMSRKYWGYGIMPEALRAVIDYLMDEAHMNRVAACHDIRNAKSGRVMAKAGMKKEGVLRQAGKNNLGICDEVWYSVIPSDRTPS
ncbi:MAG: GNAT family N-acetyltransferase [Clostridia bacterium]|nr:GNAT family N-acetyltransferase [Clostridia bacterium]MBR2288015.1 GNAT family N-acetyltransferase [Clostridia bacterium]